MKSIGIDPGLAATGVGIVVGRETTIEAYSFGSIETSPDMPLPGRLARIYERLGELLEAERPDLMVVEDVFSLPRYPKSGILLGKVIGVILLAGSRQNIPVLEVPVREAKQLLSGNGNAGKEQLELAVRHLLRHPGPIRPDHASDAMALAIIGQFRYGNGSAFSS
ncbi:MAG: crossover junction endodeoxyribonuclease RuvC [Thermodesulfobacteriota bacterium]